VAAYHRQNQYPIEIPRASRTLGDAYARVGRVGDARHALNQALALLGQEAPDYQLVLSVRERLGRFALDQGDLKQAQLQFQQVLAQAHARRIVPILMAHGGLARVALAQNDRDTMLRESAIALSLWNEVSGFRDVRAGPYLQRIRADALAASGDVDAAQELEDQAAAASARYDDPSSPTVQRRDMRRLAAH
jgi:tetratricopeptide (TPR) repeat protein